MTERHHVTSIETYSGHYLDYFNPRADQIEIADIARGLAHTCRYAGQTTVYYSVAEHAVRVRDWVKATESWPPALALGALHHDSHEAYLGDWPSPLKHVFDSELLEDLAKDLDDAIAQHFGFSTLWLYDRTVKAGDLALLRAEAATLKYSHGIGPHWANEERHTPLAGIGWSPERAERKFLEAHNHEMRQLHG